jgi:hypothetical protein
MRFGAISALTARICRNGAIMFVLLLLASLLPLENHPWLLLALIVPLGFFLYLILKDLVVMWRQGAWRTGRVENDESTPSRGLTERSRGAQLTSSGWIGGSAPSHGSSFRAHRVTVSRDALARSGSPHAVPATTPIPHDEWEAGLSVDVESIEEGLIDIAVRVSDGRLAARTHIQSPLESALRFGDALRGFPTHDSDRRDATLGTFDAGNPGGGLRVVLFRRAGSSHAYVTVWPDARHGADGRQSLSVSFGVRPATLEGFVRAVSAAPLSPGVHAELPMTGLL